MSEPLVEVTNYPLYVVTANAGEELSGCMAGFVTQSSIEPLQFIVCISTVNHTFEVARRSQFLALHLIGADQEELASLFGEETGDEVDKFSAVQWARGVTGAPVLAECVAWVEGPILDTMNAGDHEAFLLGVRRGGSGTHRGQFMLQQAANFEPGHPV